MHTFEFIRPPDPAAAIAAAAQAKTAQQGADVRFMGGGTTLIDLMKLNVETPARVLDINRLPFDKIEVMPDGGLKIGATVRNSDLAYHAKVQSDYSVLSQHGHCRRKSFATHTVRLLPRHCDALQQTRTRQRLSGDHRSQSHPRDPWRE
jgi:hypothetical protein